MNLLEIRQKFRTISGRWDLVNEDGSDNGADFFIYEGQKYLDRLDETQKSWANYYRFLETGHYFISFPYCRALKEVWAATPSSRWQLKKKDLQDLMEGYLTTVPSSRTVGTPLYYSPCITRYIPENADITDLEAFLGFVEVPAGNAHEYNSIMVNVPVSEKTMITLTGLFYSAKLTNDDDRNYWSEVHPLLLINATMRQIEVTNRNTQGVNDWTMAIRDEMQQLGFDLIEELIAETNQMGD
jgi:hypothetical protein